MTNELVARDDKGRFVPGQSGNPEGKAKGLRNFITHERLMLESALREYVGKPEQAEKLLKGINRVIEIAVSSKDEKHVISAMKLLLDRIMPSIPQKIEDEADKTDRRLEIIIRTNPDAKVPVQAVIDGEFTEIEEKPCPTSKQDSPPTKTKAAKEPTASTTKATNSSRLTSAPGKAKRKRKKVAKKAPSNA